MNTQNQKIEKVYLKLLNTDIKVDLSDTCKTGLIGFSFDHGGRLWRKTSDFQIFVKPVVSHSQKQLETLLNVQYEQIEKMLGLK